MGCLQCEHMRLDLGCIHGGHLQAPPPSQQHPMGKTRCKHGGAGLGLSDNGRVARQAGNNQIFRLNKHLVALPRTTRGACRTASMYIQSLCATIIIYAPRTGSSYASYNSATRTFYLCRMAHRTARAAARQHSASCACLYLPLPGGQGWGRPAPIHATLLSTSRWQASLTPFSYNSSTFSTRVWDTDLWDCCLLDIQPAIVGTASCARWRRTTDATTTTCLPPPSSPYHSIGSCLCHLAWTVTYWAMTPPCHLYYLAISTARPMTIPIYLPTFSASTTLPAYTYLPLRTWTATTYYMVDMWLRDSAPAPTLPSHHLPPSYCNLDYLLLPSLTHLPLLPALLAYPTTTAPCPWTHPLPTVRGLGPLPAAHTYTTC